MAVYDIDGNELLSVYNVDGNLLSQAYDIDGNPLLNTHSDLIVMTYNVQRFKGINAQQTMQNMIISKNEPDIIGMQEMSQTSTLPEVGQIMLQDYPIKQQSNHQNYILMASKSLALSNVVIQDFTNQDPEDMSQWHETRAYMKADITVAGKTITWINTHLCYITQSVKWLQMGEIFNLAEQCEYVIVTGDFNSNDEVMSATSDDYLNMYKQFVDAGYHLANNSPTSGFHNTYSNLSTAASLADLQYAPDSIICSSNITIDRVVFDNTKLSYLNGSAIDHIPVVAYLTIN